MTNVSSSGGPSVEDLLLVLMESLVAPWLPFMSFTHDTRKTPSINEQETVAKQVHAAVVLHNYYHKKQQPNAEILDFRKFCMLAVIIKPSLMGHLKIMHHADITEIEDVENQLSLTEKAVISALDISKALNPSKNFPSIENWEVSGVAVLLVNSTQEKCFLQYGNVVKGVWSLIERDIQVQGAKNERIKRRRRASKSQVDKAALLPLALLAVEEDTGIKANVVLEHTVYSLSREKRAVQFYIMQSVQSIDEDFHPIKDVIERLRGPVVSNRDHSWEATQVVEYFQLLPYAEVIEAWFSSGFEAKEHNQDVDDSLVQKNDSGTRGVGLQYVTYNNSQIHPKEHNQDVADPSMVDCQTNQQALAVDDPSNETCKLGESFKKVTNNGNVTSGVDECHTDQQIVDPAKPSMANGKTNSDSNVSNKSGISVGFLEQIAEKPNVDTGDSSMLQLQNKDKEYNDRQLIVYRRRKRKSFSNINANGKTGGLKVRFEEADMVGKTDEVNKTQNIVCSNPVGHVMGDQAIVSHQSNTGFQNKLQASQVPKELSQIAMDVLLRKKKELEGEMAMCEKSIQTIMDKGKNDSTLAVETLVDACYDAFYKGEAEGLERASQLVGTQVLPALERKKLSDADIPSLNLCQEMDVMCHTNCWTLPTYQVYPVEGGYRASIKLEGADFEFCEEGNLYANESSARESAAGKMIAKLQKLQSVAGKSH